MNFHLALSIIALVASISSVGYVAYASRQWKGPMSRVDLLCATWNDANPVGTYIAYEPETADANKGSIAVRTLSKAYAKNGIAVVDVERFKTIELHKAMVPIGLPNESVVSVHA